MQHRKQQVPAPGGFYLTDNRIFYGACGLNNLERVHQKAAIGFWLLPEYWGSGIITAAVSLVCDYGFNSLRLHRRVALIETENDNSKKSDGLYARLNSSFTSPPD